MVKHYLGITESRLQFALFAVVRDVHKVTQWDEKGVMKIFEALKSVVSEYINDVQRVS
jgi:hypothetical protein